MSNVKVMPHIGIIGGTTWPSTLRYLQKMLTLIQEKTCGLNSPNLTLIVENCAEIDALMRDNAWCLIRDFCVDQIAHICKLRHLDAVVILSNVMHNIADDISNITAVPLIHIGDCTAQFVHDQGLRRVGFFGRKLTMQQDFILQSFRRRGIEVVIPPTEYLDKIDDYITLKCSRNDFGGRFFFFSQITNMIVTQHIDGVVWGSAELGRAMTGEDWSQWCWRNYYSLMKRLGTDNLNDLVNFPIIDTTECHINAIADFCCRYGALH